MNNRNDRPTAQINKKKTWRKTDNFSICHSKFLRTKNLCVTAAAAAAASQPTEVAM